MTDRGDSSRNRKVAMAILLVVTIVGGLVLTFTGVGAQLSEPQDVRVTVWIEDLREEVAGQVEVGHEVFTDPGGMLIGEIVEAEVGPLIRAVVDSQGGIHEVEDPVLWEATVVIEAKGREADGLVAIENEVIQAGRSFTVVTDRYALLGEVVSLDVR